jgi:hypothetical protein
MLIADQSFADGLWLAVVDKLLLGGILAVAGYVFSRSLERYKSREALRGAIAKERAQQMAAAWGRVSDAEARLLDSLIKANGVVARELKAQRLDATRNEHASVNLPSDTLDEVLGVAEHIRNAKDAVQRDRFWLGDHVTGSLLNHLSHLEAIAMGMPRTLTMATAAQRIGQLAKIRAARDDITAVIDTL